MAKPHNTGWDMSTCCIFTTIFQEASEQEIWICTYFAYSEWQHYFLFLIIKTTYWLTVYHDKLLKLKNSHPDIYEKFKNGCFSLKQTSKPFSRIPIDLTLEQTINADAACQRSGIISLTNSISARQHWAQSHSIRTSILSKLFEELGMASEEVISEELKLHRVKQNCHHLEKIVSSINDTHESFCVNHWERASFQYSQWESSTGWKGRLFNQRLGHWFQCTWLFDRRLQWWSKRLPEPHQAKKVQKFCFWSW